MRTLRSQKELGAGLARSALILSLLVALVAGACDIGVSGGDDDGGGGDGGNVTPPPPPPPPPAGPAIYKVGALIPQFQLMSVVDQANFAIPFAQPNQVALTSAQFTNLAANFPLLSQKMDEIANHIEALNGVTPELTRLRNQLLLDQDRTLAMPMRGEPSDVSVFIDPVTLQRKIFVPLPGGISSPNNEVAIVNDDGRVSRVKVGLRPVATAVHPLGVVFVLNQYENQIHVIDPVTEELLLNDAGQPVTIPTEYYGSDILLAERNPSVVFDDEDFFLYVANEYRGVLLKYELQLVRSPINNEVVDVARVNVPPAGQPESTPDATIVGVGHNPQKLRLDEQQSQIYVAGLRGGEVAEVDIATDQVKGYSGVGAPSMDIIEIQGDVFVATTTPFRGLLDDEANPEDMEAPRLTATGIDGSTQMIHAGSFTDRNPSYNFQGLGNGIQTLDTNLVERDPFNMTYFTDTLHPDPSFVAAQKQITATIPIAMEILGNQLFLAGAGNDTVQVLDVVGGQFPLRDNGNPFLTGAAPQAIAIDPVNEQLLVVGLSERLEIFDLNSRDLLDSIDLGYATLPFPGTDLEEGKIAYINTEWSSGRLMSCMSCHTDHLIADGFGYSNGASAATTYHQVQPTWNLSSTDNFFWQGSGFSNNSYKTLAFAAQTRTNCDLITFGFVEGVNSDPARRIGDPTVANRIAGENDAACRPLAADATGLPANFDTITAENARQKALLEVDLVQDLRNIGVNVNTLLEASRVIDWWAASELRLPPNVNAFLNRQGQLSAADSAKITRGQQLFTGQVGCALCHQPDNFRAPFTDGAYHGPGARWPQNYVQRYINDPRIDFAGTAAMMVRALASDKTVQADDGINFFQDIDSFEPFAFNSDDVLIFEDPTSQPIGSDEENRRIDIANIFNNGDAERGHWPGNPIGQHRTNTPSLRGVWWHTALLHTGLARSIREAVLGPGHPALKQGLFLNGGHPDVSDQNREIGWATNNAGSLEAHGVTQNLSPDDVDALVAYVLSIE